MDSGGSGIAPIATVRGKGEEQVGGGRAAMKGRGRQQEKGSIYFSNAHADAVALAHAMGEPRGSQAMKPIGHDM
jgi:hypothetical protein